MPKIKYIIGVDEAGRGPLAGPVAVGAFAVAVERKFQLLKFFPNGKIKDSKKLKPETREGIFKLLQGAKKRAEVLCAVSFSSEGLIDKKGLSFAIKNALAQSLKKLGIKPAEATVLLDGSLYAPKEFQSQQTIIKGDEREAVIALASIMAKVSRDRKMLAFARKYPEYDFEVHKGYGTKAHYAKINRHGMSPIHRRSFLKNLVK